MGARAPLGARRRPSPPSRAPGPHRIPPAPAKKGPAAPEFELHAEPERFELVEPTEAALSSEPEFGEEFDVNRLSLEEQELHRRANRVAKVSMQDIKMLRPEQVRLGRQNTDPCTRLKNDIEKAHREYDRRFRPLIHHPVDYFYRWM